MTSLLLECFHEGTPASQSAALRYVFYLEMSKYFIWALVNIRGGTFVWYISIFIATTLSSTYTVRFGLKTWYVIWFCDKSTQILLIKLLYLLSCIVFLRYSSPSLLFYCVMKKKLFLYLSITLIVKVFHSLLNFSRRL